MHLDPLFQVVTFQLVLATDYLTTYSFFLYDEASWDLRRRFWPRVVIGYDAKDYSNYENVQLSSNQYLRIHEFQGNTGRTGEWYFNNTSPGETNSAGLCLKWSQRQVNMTSVFEGVPSCPCTRLQAWRDWRFWFGYYWGLSARPNCATLLFSRVQSTIECCYDDDGSLIVGANNGGSYLLYNPLFLHQQNAREDRLPHRYCCEDSKLCQLYYEHRPSDDCSNYVTVRPCKFVRCFKSIPTVAVMTITLKSRLLSCPCLLSGWVFGDPHFRSVDNNTFTFNGIGEYLLLESSNNQLTIQTRLEQFEDTGGSVMSAIIIQQANIGVQVEAENGALKLYVQGDLHPLPTGDDIYIVTENGINSVANDGSSIENVASLDPLVQPTSNDQLFVRVDDSGTLLITTPDGASLMVSLQMSFLQTAVELSSSYTNNTRGLVGVFNGDPADDFTLPNGTVLQANLTEAEVYSFGLECKSLNSLVTV